MNTRIDPYSQKEFTPKRRNQVFATPRNRREYHNEKAAELRNMKSSIAKCLDTNLKILTQLVDKGRSMTFSINDLTAKGFNTNYFTHLEEYNGETCRCIYHFILPTSKNAGTITIIHPSHD